MLKISLKAESRHILGVHAIGHEAAEIVNVVSAAIRSELTLEELLKVRWCIAARRRGFRNAQKASAEEWCALLKYQSAWSQPNRSSSPPPAGVLLAIISRRFEPSNEHMRNKPTERKDLQHETLMKECT
jgi:hypothetical protein